VAPDYRTLHALPGRRPVWRWSLWSLVGTLGVLAGTLAGCGGSDTTGPPPMGASRAYWALQFNYHAVVLALTPPYDTVQLTATPVNATGTPLPGLGSVTYKATDSLVTVSSTGLVTAHYQTTGTLYTTVSATLQAQGVTLTDTVFIQVTPTVSKLKTFSIHPAPGDSARRPLDAASFSWPATATDLLGDTLCNGAGCTLPVYYSSSDPLLASIDKSTAAVTLADTGHVIFTASTLVYGQLWRDSVRFTSGFANYTTVAIQPGTVGQRAVLTFSAPNPLIIGEGGNVLWTQPNVPSDASGNPVETPGLDSIDVVFDDSTAAKAGQIGGIYCSFTGFVHDVFCTPTPPDSGNIPAFGPDTAKYNAAQTSGDIAPFLLSVKQARTFPRAGNYHYHSRLYGTTGTIYVRRMTP
jgi:hypothetical protein